MKPAALIFGLACFLVPGYGVYSMAIGHQESFNAAKKLDSGELLINSQTALMRARFCDVLEDESTGDIIPSLVGVEKMLLAEGSSGPQFVCAPDGTTARQRYGELAEFAAVKQADLGRFHDILDVRGVVQKEDLAGFLK